METPINKWKCFKMNLYVRILFLKRYVISLVQYQIKAFAIPGRYLRKMNMLMFKYVWNSRWEKIERKILVRSLNNGGFNMIDLKKRREAYIFSQINSIPQNMNQHWACLYVYWFGLLLKPLHPNLASNLWVHTLADVFSTFTHTQTRGLPEKVWFEYESIEINWSMSRV